MFLIHFSSTSSLSTLFWPRRPTMNATRFFSRALAGLLVTSILVGCGSQPPLLVPQQDSYPYGGRAYYSARGSYPYGVAVAPYGVATPYLGESHISGDRRTTRPGVNSDVLHPLVIADMLGTARGQLQVHCNAETVASRAASETVVSIALGAIIGAAVNGRNGALGGTVLGAAAGGSYSQHKCQIAVNWHHQVLMAASRTLQAYDARCRYTEHDRVESRKCSETVFGPWRRQH